MIYCIKTMKVSGGARFCGDQVKVNILQKKVGNET